MSQKINPIAIRVKPHSSNFSWFSDYYYTQIFHKDHNFVNYSHPRYTCGWRRKARNLDWKKQFNEKKRIELLRNSLKNTNKDYLLNKTLIEFLFINKLEFSPIPFGFLQRKTSNNNFLKIQEKNGISNGKEDKNTLKNSDFKLLNKLDTNMSKSLINTLGFIKPNHFVKNVIKNIIHHFPKKSFLYSISLSEKAIYKITNSKSDNLLLKDSKLDRSILSFSQRNSIFNEILINSKKYDLIDDSNSFSIFRLKNNKLFQKDIGNGIHIIARQVNNRLDLDSIESKLSIHIANGFINQLDTNVSKSLMNPLGSLKSNNKSLNKYGINALQFSIKSLSRDLRICNLFLDFFHLRFNKYNDFSVTTFSCASSKIAPVFFQNNKVVSPGRLQVTSNLSYENKVSIISIPFICHNSFQSAWGIAKALSDGLENKISFRVLWRSFWMKAMSYNSNLINQKKEFNSLPSTSYTRNFQNQINNRFIKGIRVKCAGRINGAEIAKTEWKQFGLLRANDLEEKIDYACCESNTEYGILGIKVWISFI